MAQEPGVAGKRIEIPYFEGTNSLTAFNVAKRTEFFHTENARSVQVGSVEKRGGQVVWGTAPGPATFITNHNSGILFFQKPISGTNQGLYRMSEGSTPGLENLYYLNNTNVWTALSGKGADINAGRISSSASKKNMFIVNYNDNNRYILPDGVTVMDSNDAGGHLYNSPKSHFVTYYKGIIYLANYRVDMGTGASATIINPGTGYTTSSNVATTGGGSAVVSVNNSVPNFLVIGASYTIVFFGIGDDFSNIGGINTTGDVFIATGIFPFNWSNGSILATTIGYASGLTVDIVASGGIISSVVINDPGTGYSDGDVITISTGGGDATFTLHTNYTTYPTTVLQSSYALGLISLFSADYPGLGDPPIPTSGTLTVSVTDVSYIYPVPGANTYEIRRGNDLVATATVLAVSALSLTIDYSFVGSFTEFKSVDEIWIAGTYTGEKVFRWPFNPTPSGSPQIQVNSFELSGGDDDPITMMANVGNDILISNKNDISSWNGYILQNFDLGMGCVSPSGFIKMLGTLYFIHYSGIYASTGSVPKYISAKVDRYFKGASKAGLEASVAGKKGRSIFFTLGDVILYNPDGSVEKTMQDVCVEFNSLQENWFVHTNVKATSFVTFIESSNPDRLMFTDSSGNKAVKEFLSGTTDDGDSIFMRLDINKLTLNPSWENNNNPFSIMMDSERGTSIKTFVSLTEGNPEWYELEGTMEKGISILKIKNKDSDRVDPPVCRVLGVSLRDSSEQISKINRIAILFIPTDEQAIIE